MTFKGWHLLVLLIIAYIIGAMFPGPYQLVRAKTGI